MHYRRILSVLLLLLWGASCKERDVQPSGQSPAAATPKMFAKGTFGYDLEFLQAYHDDLIVLGKEAQGPQLILSPAYQGRVMTSSAEGLQGTSYGWINYDLIASGKKTAHINPVGGEERFWLGPEGGQFSIYFKKGNAFDFEHWYVPKELDTEPFNVLSATDNEARFEKEMHLENYAGTRLDLMVNRSVRLLERHTIDSMLGIRLPADIKIVGFESDNQIRNIGKMAWTKQSGLLSIWILSMLNASDQTVVVIPYNQKGNGPVVTDDYFGKVPADRLRIRDGLLFFKADAHYRSKIGLSPGRARPLAASYDAERNMLTLAQFTLQEGVNDYVNSLWKQQDNPFNGDAVNAYNDGPIEGKQMGKFYELESSSPAAALLPGQTIQHLHRTIHLKGSKAALNTLTQHFFGLDVDGLAW